MLLSQLAPLSPKFGGIGGCNFILKKIFFCKKQLEKKIKKKGKRKRKKKLTF